MTIKLPSASTAISVGTRNSAPLPMLASDRMVRLPLVGSTRKIARKPSSSTASWPLASIVKARTC